MWKAVFAAIGAVVGPFIGGFLGRLLVGTSRHPVFWLGMPPVFWVAVPLGGALFCLLGFRLGSVLHRRARRDGSSDKWKGFFSAVGAAVGPLIGFYAVGAVAIWSIRSAGHADEFTGLTAMASAIVLGVPIGGALFCLLGLWLGSPLDRRARPNHSLQK
jgi:MFS family permease